MYVVSIFIFLAHVTAHLLVCVYGGKRAGVTTTLPNHFTDNFQSVIAITCYCT